VLKVLVTGATGYLGRNLIPSLIESGHDVTAFVRTTSNIEGLPEDVRVSEGDVLDFASLESVVQGMDAVIHLAAYFDFYPKDTDLMYRVNVEGVQNTLNACVGTSVQRFIYCSSAEAIGPVKYPPGNEDTELNPSFDYSKSKVQAEQAIRGITEDTGLAHVILRPTGIIGEGEFYVAFEAIQAVNEGDIPFIPGDGEKVIMFTYIDDVVSGFVAALSSQSAINRTIILCPDEGLTYNALFEFFGECLGVNPPKRHIPASLAKLGIGLLSPIKNRGKTTFMWHMQSVQSMDEHRWYTNERARKLLGWEPQVTLTDAIKRVIDWYHEHGHLEWKL
jgi:nucleoside-diphosphate-sugar epimerase